VHAILFVSLAAALISPSVSVVPAGPPPVLETSVQFDGGCVHYPLSIPFWDCIFNAWTTDPSLVFFRWDFDGDGRWDSGYPGDDGWTTDLTPRYASDRDGILRVCVQAWDGLTVREVDGRIEPVGPTACRTYVLSRELTSSPLSWDRDSTGRVTLMLDITPEFAPPTRRPHSARLYAIPGGYEGIPVKVWSVYRGPGGEPIVATFLADCPALSAYLGPGRHVVVLWVEWGGPVVEGAGEVTIA